MLKASVTHAPWLHQRFPTLCGLHFTAAAADPSFNQLTGQYLSTGMKRGDVQIVTQKDGDRDGEYKPTKLAPNTVWSGQRSFTGRWLGELEKPAGYSIMITKLLSSGSHGVVYAGQLWQAELSIAEVAIKVSNSTSTVLDEFCNYSDLKDVMGSHIPRCYGALVMENGAFLITERLESRKIIQSDHEQRAIDEALTKLHAAGWQHNDLIDIGSFLRNIAWTHSGQAALIDLVTATRHECHDGCEELEGARSVLQLENPRVIV
ncbi:hypothetical protein C8R45DRAFT_994672 [Mycena sanguinolenta]|nr:hypothetical protein C8R45DRAFT_994672 [Mycena sanguinolenta]